MIILELRQSISCKTTYVPSKDSDHSAYLFRQIRVFAVQLKMLWILGCPQKCLQRQVSLHRCAGWTESAGCTCCCEGNAMPWIILVIPLLHWLDNSASYLQRRRIFFSCFSMKICCRHVLELPNRNSTKLFLLVLIRTVLGFIVQSIARLAEDPGGASLNPSSPT